MTATSQDPIREAARAVVYLLWANTAHSSDTEATERAEEVLRSVLPELSELLGELAVKTHIMSAISDIFGRGYSTPGRFEAALFDLEDEIKSALYSDAGRLAGEALRAMVKERLADRLVSEGPEAIGLDEPAEGYENHWMDARADQRAKTDALIARFPRLREEVEP